MAWVKTVDESAAQGDTAEFYHRLKRLHDCINKAWLQRGDWLTLTRQAEPALGREMIRQDCRAGRARHLL